MLLFSIIIPTFNRAVQLRNCLSAIAALDFPADNFEVIVVDDGSKSLPDAIVNKFSKSLKISLLSQKNSGPAAARNNGADRATGQFLVFTDDDCAPATDWLTQIARQIKSTPDALIGGKSINAIPENIFSETSQLLIDYLYDYFESTNRDGRFFTSNNLVVPANLFHKLGGFDSNFPLAAGEDRAFCERWTANGWQSVYLPDAKIYHFHTLTFAGFWRQHFNYGCGVRQLQQNRQQRAAKTPSLQPLSFYVNLLMYPLRRARSFRALAGILLMLISQIATAAGYFFSKKKMSGKPIATGESFPENF